jgi:hypothetical protein
MDNKIPVIKQRSEYSTALLVARVEAVQMRILQRSAELLHRERASSLTEAKNVLELAFWMSAADRNEISSEFQAKLWLDTQRASFVNRLVS